MNAQTIQKTKKARNATASSAPKTPLAAVPKPARRKKVEGVRGLYQDLNSGMYLRRVQHGGRDTYESLGTCKKAQAIATLDDFRLADTAHRRGLTISNKNGIVTVQEVLERYRDDGFPDHRGVARKPGRHLDCEKAAVPRLLAYFDDHDASALCQNILDDYHAERTANVRTGDGHRTTDLEINTLNNAMKWAVRKQMLATNPISNRARYHDPIAARHCREVSPTTTEELHDTASKLFASRSGQVLGWQALFEAFTGLRTSEVIQLRMNAAPDEPGWITPDDSMVVRRVKRSKKDNPYVALHPALKQLMEAHRSWHQAHHPDSPWFFPGRSDPQSHVDGGALTHALQRLLDEKKITRKYTSHGMRAFYVLVRRSQKIPDIQIAWEINHVGGVSTLENVYGGIPANWRNNNAKPMEWLPTTRPAAWINLSTSRSDLAPETAP